MKAKFNALFSVLALLFLWLVWVVAYFAVRNDYLLPSFWETFAEMGRLLADATFWRAFGGTLLRTFIAFAASFLLGFSLALLAALSRGVRAFLNPIVSVLRTVPTMAVILALLLWTNALVAPVIVALLVLMPAVYAAAIAAVDDVDARFSELARAFRVGAGRKLVRMYLPLVAPAALSQAGAIFSMGLKITISGEVLANTYRSLGGMMQEAKMFVEMPALMALTLVAVLLGFAIEGGCALIARFAGRRRA